MKYKIYFYMLKKIGENHISGKCNDLSSYPFTKVTCDIFAQVKYVYISIEFV